MDRDREADSATAALTARVTEALNTVIDPCSCAAGAPAGLVDMGLIRTLDIAEQDDGLVATVVVRVTHPGCFMAPFFLAQVQEVLGRFPEITAVDTCLDPGYDWTPADLSDSYRQRLARHRAAAGMGPELPLIPKP